MVKVRARATTRAMKCEGDEGLANKGVLAVNISAEIHSVKMIRVEDIKSLNMKFEIMVVVCCEYSSPDGIKDSSISDSVIVRAEWRNIAGSRSSLVIDIMSVSIC